MKGGRRHGRGGARNPARGARVLTSRPLGANNLGGRGRRPIGPAMRCASVRTLE